MTSNRQGGFAVLVVLWTVGLLALLIAGLSASARSKTELAANVRDGAVAQAVANGAVHKAIFELLRNGGLTAGPTQQFTIGRASVVVSIEDQSGRFNPNLIAPPMLAALLGAVGVEPALATDLSRAVVDWRTVTAFSLAGGLKLDRYRAANLPYGPPNRPFKSIDELGLVPGMTPELLAQIRPYLSVYQAGDARQTADAALAHDVLASAAMIGRQSALVGYASPDRLVLIQARATLVDRADFVRRAVVRLSAQSRPGQRPWQILSWESSG